MSIKSLIQKIRYYDADPHISYGTRFDKQDTDYEIVCSVQDNIAVPPKNIPEARNKFSGIQYYQPEINENSCSLHGPATILSALTGITFTPVERKIIWDKEVAAGNASPDWGGYSYKMVNAWRKYWNSQWAGHDDKMIASMAVEMGSPLYYALLEKGYGITSGYRWMDGYDKDWSYDDIVNRQWDNDPDLENYGAYQNGGHCLAWFKSDTYARKGSSFICVDNYVTSPTRVKYNNNIYGIDDSVVQNLLVNKVWHEWGYVFMFKSDIEKANLEINTKLIQRLSNSAPGLGTIVSCEEYGKYGIVQNNELKIFTGKDISELYKVRKGDKDETFLTRLSQKDWDSINTNKVI